MCLYLHQSISGVLPFPVISGGLNSLLRLIVKTITSARKLCLLVCMYLSICIIVFVFFAFFICMLVFDHFNACFLY